MSTEASWYYSATICSIENNRDSLVYNTKIDICKV